MRKLQYSNIDIETYERYLKPLGSLTGLFSDSRRPLLHPRSVERLFVLLTRADDLARRDNSFDAKLDKSGVGVKTFTSASLKSVSLQKIAEFSNSIDRRECLNLSPRDLAKTVSAKRNFRLAANCTQFDIDIRTSFYHCVVRVPGGIVIHEEPMRTISTSHLYPTDARGKRLSVWPRKFERNASLHFTDGIDNYSFHLGKSVLLKKFALDTHETSRLIKVRPIGNIFEFLLSLTKPLKDDASGFRPSGFSETSDTWQGGQSAVLPLYSTRTGKVPDRSGLNQWLALGRERTFGEAYLAIPSKVREINPNFFPPIGSLLTLKLPNGREIQVKVCQEGGKALMSRPNSLLGQWLLSSLDGSIEAAQKRFTQKIPYESSDLDIAGVDGLLFERMEKDDVYSVSLAPIGSYEEFLLSNL
jgi:hypothetical protein